MFEEYGNIIIIDANLLASNINTEEANNLDRKKPYLSRFISVNKIIKQKKSYCHINVTLNTVS
jgi:hypothetical protein